MFTEDQAVCDGLIYIFLFFFLVFHQLIADEELATSRLQPELSLARSAASGMISL